MVVVAALLTAGGPTPAANWLAPIVATCAVALAAWTVRRGRADRAAFEADLARRAAADAVTVERVNLARELHDLVSHGLGFITVRAAVARRAGITDDSGAALAEIEAASRAATTELRRMLHVLRSPTVERPPCVPLPGLADVPGLISNARASGLTVTADLDALGELSAGAQLAVYRIVHEALANTARHAGPTTVDLTARRDGERITIVIRDRGPVRGWHAAPGAGLGLTGLSERLGSLGGSLSGRAHGSGFELTATLIDRPAETSG